MDGLEIRNTAAYRFSALEPAWGAMTSILYERRDLLIDRLIKEPNNHDTLRGAIMEVDDMMGLLERLRLEAKT